MNVCPMPSQIILARLDAISNPRPPYAIICEIRVWKRPLLSPEASMISIKLRLYYHKIKLISLGWPDRLWPTRIGLQKFFWGKAKPSAFANIPIIAKGWIKNTRP